MFTAREMPDPAKPAFRPDQSLVAPVTTPREFKLATDERFGKPVSREGGGNGTATFAASLRGGSVAGGGAAAAAMGPRGAAA